jgi:hypothetical protein
LSSFALFAQALPVPLPPARQCRHWLQACVCV